LGFQRVADATLAASTWFSRAIQAGGHPRYLTITLLFAAGVSSAAVAISNGLPITVVETQLTKPGAALLPTMVAAAGTVLTLLVPGRVAKLVMMAVAGYGIALFYVAFRAPDLALTQILVETIALVLLLLALRRLPHLGRDQRTWVEHTTHGFVAMVAGLGLSALAWFSGIYQVSRSAGNEHLARALPEAHGRNVVNVILVDFRGADTLGEISVLAIAAIGVVALLPVVRSSSSESKGKGKRKGKPS
jgi:multisubunit Na+/H+ antiporter MnhB subunit